MADRIRVNVRLYGEALSFTMAADGRTVLEGARDAGIDLPTSCEAGSCATCRAHVVSGEVDMRTNLALDADEVAAGFVLVCQSVPRDGEIELDFDR